jgi:serine/threonine protein kinase
VWLAMERVPGRELFEMVEEKGALAAATVASLMRQLLTALEALARLGVVHRDVKPENIMVSEGDGAGDGHRLTLIDFGYAAIVGGEEGAPATLTGVAGSPEYAAPEVLSWLEVEADDTGTVVGEPYDAKCDVWSVGVTAHVLVCAELPFDLPEDCTEENLVAAARNVQLTFKRPEWAGDAMGDSRDFVRRAMSVSRHERPSAGALLEHPWVRGEGGDKPAAGDDASAHASKDVANAQYLEMLDEVVEADAKAADAKANQENEANSAASAGRAC